jgi:hypothetical protein
VCVCVRGVVCVYVCVCVSTPANHYFKYMYSNSYVYIPPNTQCDPY